MMSRLRPLGCVVMITAAAACSKTEPPANAKPTEPPAATPTEPPAPAAAAAPPPVAKAAAPAAPAAAAAPGPTKVLRSKGAGRLDMFELDMPVDATLSFESSDSGRVDLHSAAFDVALMPTTGEDDDLDEALEHRGWPAHQVVRKEKLDRGAWLLVYKPNDYSDIHFGNPELGVLCFGSVTDPALVDRVIAACASVRYAGGGGPADARPPGNKPLLAQLAASTIALPAGAAGMPCETPPNDASASVGTVAALIKLWTREAGKKPDISTECNVDDAPGGPWQCETRILSSVLDEDEEPIAGSSIIYLVGADGKLIDIIGCPASD